MVNYNSKLKTLVTSSDKNDKRLRISMEPPTGIPLCNYIVNQYDDTTWVIPGLSEYPSNGRDIANYLNECLVEYNGEPRYKILRRRNYLTAAFGWVDKDLLLVDCELLFNAVEPLLDTDTRQVGSRTIINTIKAKLIGSVKLPIINPTILVSIKDRIAELTTMTNTLNQIYVVSSEVSAIRDLLYQSESQILAMTSTIDVLQTKAIDQSLKIAQLKAELANVKETNRKLNSELLVKATSSEKREADIAKLREIVERLA